MSDDVPVDEVVVAVDPDELEKSSIPTNHYQCVVTGFSTGEVPEGRPDAGDPQVLIRFLVDDENEPQSEHNGFSHTEFLNVAPGNKFGWKYRAIMTGLGFTKADMKAGIARSQVEGLRPIVSFVEKSIQDKRDGAEDGALRQVTNIDKVMMP